MPLVRYFYYRGQKQEQAEELTQEVFIKIWKTKKYVAKAPFSAWIYRLAQNTLRDAQRKKRPVQIQESAAYHLKHPGPEPEEQLILKQNKQKLKQALAQLSEEQRDLILLSKFDGLKYSEIAQIKKSSSNTIKVRTFRALKALKQTVQEMFHEPNPTL